VGRCAVYCRVAPASLRFAASRDAVVACGSPSLGFGVAAHDPALRKTVVQVSSLTPRAHLQKSPTSTLAHRGEWACSPSSEGRNRH
jgi:hypothetical protein